VVAVSLKNSKNNELVRAMLAAIRSQGGEPRFKKKTGTSDMNVAAEAWAGVPIIAYGPGDSKLDHRPDERLDLEEYRRSIRVLETTIERLLD
jgi:LysW-gamma-L-lysine carboxypeptidase